MFTYIGTRVDALFTGYAAAVSGAFMTAVYPVLVSAVTVWVLIQGYAILSGRQAGDVPDFVWRAARIVAITAVVGASGAYTTGLITFVNDLASGGAALMIPAGLGGTVNANPASVWASLDNVQNAVDIFSAGIQKEAGVMGWLTHLDLLAAWIMVAVAAAVMEFVAAYVVIVAKAALAFFLAVGPAFIACAMFDATRRFFDSWVGCVLSAVVTMWVAFFLVGVTIFFGVGAIQSTVDAQGALVSTVNIFAQAVGLDAVLFCLALMAWQGPTFAAALAGGSAIQQGGALVQQITMAMSGMRRGGKPAPPKKSGQAVAA